MPVENLSELERLLKYCFRDSKRLERALTHISHSKEKKLPYNYERLEFLGDSVVNYLIVDILYDRFGKLPLGRLALAKAYLISEKFLSKLAKRWELHRFVRLSKDEELKGRREDPSILADIFEAVVAAVYLDSGRSIEFLRKWFRHHFEKSVIEAVKGGEFFTDFKSLLQEITQSDLKEKPTYRLLKAEGPEHDKTFTVECKVGEFSTLGVGKTKKEAEQNAAQKMVKEHFGEKLKKLINL